MWPRVIEREIGAALCTMFGAGRTLTFNNMNNLHTPFTFPKSYSLFTNSIDPLCITALWFATPSIGSLQFRVGCVKSGVRMHRKHDSIHICIFYTTVLSQTAAFGLEFRRISFQNTTGSGASGRPHARNAAF